MMSTVPSPGGEKEEDDSLQPDVLVLVASQSFTAESFVDDVLLDKLHSASLTAESKFVDEVFGEALVASASSQDERTEFWPSSTAATTRRPALAALFVVSTYGDGDPPNHAVGFADWLGALEAKKKGAGDVPAYAVFGLGDRAYAHHAAFGKYVDRELEALGGRRLLPLATGDQSGGNQLAEFEAWSNDIVERLLVERPADRGKIRKEGAAVPFPTGTGAEFRRSVIQRDAVSATLVEVEELVDRGTGSDKRGSSPGSARSVLHIVISLPSHLVQPGDLQPGDHVGVYPENDPALVRKALRWLHVEEGTTTSLMELVEGTWTARDTTAYDFLAKHVDLAGRATPAVLRELLPFVGTLELRALARELTHVESDAALHGASAFDDWLAGRRLTTLDLAVLFECRPSLQSFAKACGPLQPRLYSVVGVTEEDIMADTDSSDGITKVSMCVALAEGGLCSNYMAKLGERLQGHEVDMGTGGSSSSDTPKLTVFFRPSRCRFVADGAPALLVAAGSGAGTVVGIVEKELERVRARTRGSPEETPSQKSLLSHLHLFIGCRTPSELLYRHRLSEFVEHGLNVYPAFSRLSDQPKTYVQDLIRRNGATIWNSVLEESGNIYLCGRLELVHEVKAAILDVAKSAGGLDDEAAERAFRDIEDAGKWRADCWSVESGHKIPGKQKQRRPRVILRLERHHSRGQPHQLQRSEDLSKVPPWPSYLRLRASGELERRVQRATDMWSACVACGRNCETNRLSADPKDWGECRVGEKAIVASAFAHFGEEDCLVGTNGSGTIFFGACNLQCMYCQNWELSARDEGDLFDDERLANTMLSLQKRGCHNINFVSPTHNLLAILRAVNIAANKGLHLPLVWNTGGYDSVAALRLLEGVIDIYMPDAKYANRKVGRKLSKVDNYPAINEAALKEMHRQVGDLQLDPETGLARRGLLVRHLVLPCHLAGTCDVMGFLAKEVSRDTDVNVMDQYRPEHHAIKDKTFGLARRPTRKELKDAHKEAEHSGLRRLIKDKDSLQW